MAWVFPERPDHRVVRELKSEDLIEVMSSVDRDGVVSLLPFNSPNVRPLMHEAKFHRNERAFQLLAEVLKRYLKDADEHTLIIPIPLSDKRRKERGYNQVEEVVKRAVFEQQHLKLRSDILYRKRDTKPQTSLSRSDRLMNMIDAFGCRLDSNFEPDSHIILVDDVSTTGATLKSAAEALRPLNVSLTLLSLAR